MLKDLLKQIKKTISNFEHEIENNVSEWSKARTPIAFREMEMEIAAKCRELQDGIAGTILQNMVSDPVFQDETSIAARQASNVRHGGCRDVNVTLLGGGQVLLHYIEYLKQNNRGEGKRGRLKKRGNGGTGLYPALAALGICFGVTPALAGEICRQVVDSDSVRAGRAALDRRGIDLGHKQTLRIVNHFGGRAVVQRTVWLQNARQNMLKTGILKGQRVVIATDGGRLRERRAHKGRRRSNGHHGFDAPWCEPKLIVVYVIDKKGNVLNKFRPISDGTMADCEGIFEMLIGYLRALGVHEARQLIIVGDGAKWIWERTAELVRRVEIDPQKVFEVIDWYHAVEKLHEIASIPSHWPNQEKAQWIKQAKKMLYRGNIKQLVAHIESLAVGRRSKKVRSHIKYFSRNIKRMQYKTFSDKKIPRGSGAIESAVRRVLNLRMKSNAKFWKHVNAEGMIFLRSYLKAERFDDLVDWSISTDASWWLIYNNMEPSQLVA